MSFEVNLVAVLAASLAAFAVGALWYGPLFGKQWKVLMGFTDESMKAMKMTMTQALSGGFVATLVLVYVLAHFLNFVPDKTISGALTLAFWVWLGFVATVMSNSVWYENKSWALYAVNASHYLVAILVAAFILAWWPWGVGSLGGFGGEVCPASARVCADGQAPIEGPNCSQTCPEDVGAY